MAFIFNELFYRPMLNLLFLIYNLVVSDLGIAIIILTLIIRFILLPLFYKSAKDQTIMQAIAPRIREIQATHKDNKEKQVQEIMAIYKEHKVNPFSGFLLLIIQLPILIGLYQVFLKGFSADVLTRLYSFVVVPEHINATFLGFFSLDERNLTLVVIAAVAQYAQSKLLMAVAPKKAGQEPTAIEKFSRNLVFIGPIITFAILYSLPSAVALYWLTTSVFSVIQQIIINKKIHAGDAKNS